MKARLAGMAEVRLIPVEPTEVMISQKLISARCRGSSPVVAIDFDSIPLFVWREIVEAVRICRPRHEPASKGPPFLNELGLPSQLNGVPDNLGDVRDGVHLIKGNAIGVHGEDAVR